MATWNEYLKKILKQIIDSYKVLNELGDKPEDLDILKKELGKIQGLAQVLANKIEKSENYSDSYSEVLSASKSYLKDYNFYNEIDRILQLYSEDHYRVKNIRLLIIAALEKTKLISKAIDLLQVL